MEKKLRLNKKGIFGLDQQVLQYMVVIIVLTVVASILLSLKDTNTNPYTQNPNRSVTFSGGAAWLPGNNQNGRTGFSIVSVYNATNHSISSPNYQVNASYGDIHLLSGASAAGQFGSSEVNISYSFSADDQTAAYNSSVKGLEGTGNYSNQMPLLATILVFVAILSAVIFLANAFRQRT